MNTLEPLEYILAFSVQIGHFGCMVMSLPYKVSVCVQVLFPEVVIAYLIPMKKLNASASIV